MIQKIYGILYWRSKKFGFAQKIKLWHASLSFVVGVCCLFGGCFSMADSALEQNTEQDQDIEQIVVPASEWQQMQSDLAAVKKQLADDAAKAAKKKEEDEKKKFSKPQNKFGGEFFWDAATGTENDVVEDLRGEFSSGTKLRQSWIWMQGTVYDMIEYRMTYDIGTGNLKDVYGGFYNLPCGVDVRLGHFKEPWSMEELSTYKSTPFIEKSHVNNLKNIVGGRNNGLMFSNWREADRYTWACGVFAASMKEDSLDCFGDESNIAFTIRGTWLPYYCETSDGRKYLWHLGLGYSYRVYDEENASKYGTNINVRPGSQIAPETMKTGALIGMESMNAFSFETAIVRGPWSLDCEYMLLDIDDNLCDGATVQGGYIQTSWLLTGESRNYKKSGGFYGGVKPNSPFIRVCRDEMAIFSGPGAWEIAYMFGWIDLDDLAVGYDFNNGGIGTSFSHTIGLNWYLNENCRIMFNYCHAETEYAGSNAGRTGREDVFMSRFQVVF
ncbi:MAG: porin [Planctomycetia bacterium]|nr:porin [Planctomycetia bacterium]